MTRARLAEGHRSSLPDDRLDSQTACSRTGSVVAVAARARIEQLARRHLDPSAVRGLTPALAAAEAIDDEIIVLSPAFADRPGLLVLTPWELRFISADASDEALAPLERLATAEVTTHDGRPVMVVLAQDGRRTLFLVGDEEWTGRLARLVTLAMDDPGAARIVADGWGPDLTPAPPAATPPPNGARAARDRLVELDELHREGLLTDAEHAAQRAAVISQI